MFWTRLKNWEASTEKMESSIPVKRRYFHRLSHSLFYEPLQLDQTCFEKIDL